MSMNLHRYSAGRYGNGTVTVERTPSGWRWQSCQDLSVGGEWRATKREALLDLDAYCSPEATAARSAARRRCDSCGGTLRPTERRDGPALGGECSCWQGVR
jgi:hypothetical protein